MTTTEHDSATGDFNALADELPTEPGILTEAEHQAHREADTMARVERIEQRELQVPSHADSELLWLAQLARELWKTILAQRTTIAGMEQGQGILGQLDKCTIEDLKQAIGGERVENAGGIPDTLAVALASYFDDHPDEPGDPYPEDEIWSPWVKMKVEVALYRIATAAHRIRSKTP